MTTIVDRFIALAAAFRLMGDVLIGKDSDADYGAWCKR